MTFANPNVLYLLVLLVPLAAIKLIGDAMASRRLHRIAGPRLLPSLRRGGWRGRGLLIFFFEALALTLLVVTLARPQYGFTEREVQGQGRSIIIAIDTSRSMLAEDLTPNRLVRARLAAQDLINSLPGDRIGLIAFAGRAFLQAPLTTDHEALLESLNQFDTELIPRGGTNLGEAIQLATEVFDKAGTASHALIMFSDGDELEGQATVAARKAKEKNIMAITVGVGTRQGALLPDETPRRRAGFQRDVTGRPVRTRLEDAVLEGIARETNGLYLNLSGSSVLKERVQVILNKLDRTKTAALKEQRQSIDRYHWSLLPALACLVIAWLLRIGRRHTLAPSPAWSSGRPSLAAATLAALMALSPVGPFSTAYGGALIPTGPDPGPSPWQAFQQAEKGTKAPGELTEEQKLLKRQVYDLVTDRFDRALDEQPRPRRAAELEFGRGASRFRAGDHDAAIESFGKALASRDRQLQAEATYNLGNALADKAKNHPKQKNRLKSMIALVEEAIRHYDEALRVDPKHENARINRDLLKEYLPKLKEERQRRIQQGKQKKKDQQGEGNQKQDGQQQGQQQGQQGQQGSQGQQGQQGNQGQSGGGDESEEETDDEGEGEEPGDQGQGDQPGQGEQGQKPGEQEGKGEGDQNGDGQGGEQPSDREQAAPEGNDAERRGEQGADGELGAKNGQGGKSGGQAGDGTSSENPDQKPGADRADARRNPKTGFSRTEARALLRALSDEDYVRPLTDEAVPEGTYKNW